MMPASPIVGREREREQLRQSLEEAIAGRGRLVLVSGEAGIGKTTLIRDLIQQAEQQSALVLTGHCYDLTTTPPYGPWIELLLNFPTGDDTLPSVPDQLRQSSGMATIGSQTALFELVNSFFVDVSLRQPLLLVLEDLHWCDPASLELLRYLSRTLVDSPVLLIITYRDDELTRQHSLFQLLPPLIRETSADRIALQRLNSASIRGLASSAGLSEEDTNRLAAYLEQRSGGNPLFATELLLALETDGTIARHAGGLQLGDLDEDYLPSFVLQVIEQRLSRIDPEARRTLEVAAVIGQDVPLDVWEAVSGVEQSALDTTIEQALATRILEETPGRQGLRFTHALIREVLYSGMIPTRRRAWRRLTAETLMTLPDPDPDAVAFHLEQAGDPRLVDWLVRAGERAERRQALLMAADHFDRAQAMLDGDPERLDERAWLLFRTGLLVRHGNHTRSLQRFDEAEVVASQAGQPAITHLARAHQGLLRCFVDDYRRGLDDMRAGILALENLAASERAVLKQRVESLNTMLGVQGHATLALQLATVGHFQDARAQLEVYPESEWDAAPDAARATGIIQAALGQSEHARQAFIRSQKANEALNLPLQAAVDAYWHLRIAHIPYAADDVAYRRQLIQAIQALWTRETSGSMPERHAETIWVIEYVLCGDWNRADRLFEWIEEHATIATSVYDPWRLSLMHYRGNVAAIRELIGRKLPAGPATEPGESEYFGFALLQHLAIELALDAGETSQARAWLEAHDRLLAWSGVVLGRAENQLLWARYHQLAGDLDQAHRCATSALERASEPRQPLALLAAHRLLGEIETQQGQITDAEHHLDESLRLADACVAPYDRALTMLALAELRAATGNTSEAKTLLDQVREICAPLQAKLALDQADRLAASLETTRQSYPAGLTPREVEVLRLVAEGLTDPEVAGRLFVSPRTVSSHLTSVYTKLGVSSRAAATRVAVERGLL